MINGRSERNFLKRRFVCIYFTIMTMFCDPIICRAHIVRLLRQLRLAKRAQESSQKKERASAWHIYVHLPSSCEISSLEVNILVENDEKKLSRTIKKLFISTEGGAFLNLAGHKARRKSDKNGRASRRQGPGRRIDRLGRATRSKVSKSKYHSITITDREENSEDRVLCYWLM